MSIRDDIREILADGRTRTAAQIAEALGKPVVVIAQQLGGMGAVRDGTGPDAQWSLAEDAAPRVASRPLHARTGSAAQREAPPPPEPVEFDAAVWTDSRW